jgi:hypothetical protein
LPLQFLGTQVHSAERDEVAFALAYFEIRAAMGFLQQYLQTYPLLSLAQLAFTIWMLVDAYRRPAETFWLWIILLAPFVGPLAYFLVVKAGDFRGLTAWSFFQRRTPLDELRYRAEHMPTLTNHLALAERLIERGEHAEAVPHLEAARQREPEHGQVLYLLAVCHRELGHPEQALPLLETVLRRDRQFSDYAAWHLLIELRAQCGDRTGALESCRELERRSPTLRHRCLLAENLMAEGQADEAWDLLEKALQEHHYMPGHIRRRNHRWARKARSLQKRVASH